MTDLDPDAVSAARNIQGSEPRPDIGVDVQLLFAPGWLDEHLAGVMAELLGRASEDRPRLTGERAQRVPLNWEAKSA